MSAREQPEARGFSHVRTWVFDLDNTLYPHHANLWQQVDVRIRDYIAEYLKITHDEAFRLQKDYYKRYGTTLRGLMIEHGLAPDAFLDFVHQIDHSPLEPNPALGTAIEQLPGRKLILTNGTRQHAERGAAAARACTTISRTCSTSSRPTWSRSRRRRPMTGFSWRTTSIRCARRCSRISRATSRSRMHSA